MKHHPSPTLKPVPIGQPVELAVADLARLHEGSRQVSSIQRIRASHHRIARLTARYMNAKQIAAYVGMSPERVRQLQSAPAMKELIATYTEKVEEQENEELDAYLSLKTANMIAAERHISDAIAELDEAGELLPVKTALAISADGADRTGYGKRQTNLNINADFAAMLEKAIKRSGKVIDSVVNQPRQTLPSPTPPPVVTQRQLTRSVEDSPRPLIARRA